MRMQTGPALAAASSPSRVMLGVGLLLLLLGGCAQVEPLVGQLPTARYCHEVHYDRVGREVEMSVKCTAPFGGL